jgi:hypothetical protein
MTELENLRLKIIMGKNGMVGTPYKAKILVCKVDEQGTKLHINELLAILLVNYLCLSPLLLYCIVAIKERLNTECIDSAFGDSKRNILNC